MESVLTVKPKLWVFSMWKETKTPYCTGVGKTVGRALALHLADPDLIPVTLDYPGVTPECRALSNVGYVLQIKKSTQPNVRLFWGDGNLGCSVPNDLWEATLGGHDTQWGGCPS